MKAKSIKGKSTEDIRFELDKSMADNFTPTLAIIFMSIAQDRKAICEIMSQKDIDILGASSCGEFINGYQDEGSIVILLINLPRESYTLVFEDIGDRDLSQVATHLGKTALQKFNNPGLILCSTGTSSSGEIFRGDILMQNLESVLGKQINIFGGMAGDDLTFTGSYVFTSDQSSDVAIAALILDEDKIGMRGMALSGWKPLGIKRSVTKNENEWIYTIDNQPALDMYLKYLGADLEKEEDKYKMFEDVGIHHPFLVEGIGDPIIRTPMLIDVEKGAIKMDFDMPTGTKFRFSNPPDFDIVENILDTATELKNTTNEDAEALLIFSCVGRLSALGPLVSVENDGLSEIWNAPMSGFFTYGEFGTVKHHRQGFHSTTCSWVALKEK